MTKNSMEPVKKIECADLDRILPTVEIKIVQKLSQRKYLAVRHQSRKKVFDCWDYQKVQKYLFSKNHLTVLIFATSKKMKSYFNHYRMNCTN